MPTEPEQQDSTVDSRWWIDTTDKKRPAPATSEADVGSRFFRAGLGFEQDRARDRLTDNNLKILNESQPPEGGWAYVQLAEQRHPERDVERVRRAMKLPAYARAVLVDSGRVVRVLVTGTPVGKRILEFTLGYAPSFDCWIDDEWVEERVFKHPSEAIKAAGQLVHRYLSPEEIARGEAISARV
jgi:hypothetical protein